MSYRYFYHTSDKDAVLAHSHYSDPAYNGDGAVIFGKEKKGISYEYADRLQQWEPEKADSAWRKARTECGDKNTARRIESYLRHYYDDPKLNLVCIRTGTQPFNGYPWYAYGFERKAGQEAE